MASHGVWCLEKSHFGSLNRILLIALKDDHRIQNPREPGVIIDTLLGCIKRILACVQQIRHTLLRSCEGH